MIPFLFEKEKIPDKLPDELNKEIEILKKLKTKEEVLKHAFNFLTSKYKSKHFIAIFYPKEIFTRDIFKIWVKKKYMICTHSNFVLRILLIKSGKFKEKDIIQKIGSIFYISTHQYFKINIGKKWLNVDVWGKGQGIRLGDYGSGFRSIGWKI